MQAEQLEDIDYAEENEVGHMLATVNPEAAAAIDSPPAPPDVGTMVVFIPRPGFSRMGRTEFGAMVMGAHEDRSLMLLVWMEAEDVIMETRIPFQSHNQPHSWRHVRGSAADLEARVVKLEEYLAGDDKLVDDVEQLGARIVTVESVMASDEIEQLEKRIEKLEAKKAK